MASSIVGCNLTPHFGARALSSNPMPNFVIQKHKYQKYLHANNFKLQVKGTIKRNFMVYGSNVPPQAPLPSEPSSNSMSWTLGFLVSFILPFFTNKWGPFGVIINRVKNTIQTAENIVEGVEKVAEEVDKIAEDIADDLPQGKLKDLAEFVEDVAETTAKAADGLDNVIDKVQEAEDHVEDAVESLAKEGTNSPKREKD